MAISLYKIKKWYKMLAGKSISHVEQGPGSRYSKEKVAGYYNDLTQKVLRDDPDILVPQYFVDTGEKIWFSIGVFQYGLGAYDLFLQTGEDRFRQKVLACADWAVEHQQKDGSWVTFAYESKEHPYSSMAQGEGISLLLRAHILTGREGYLDAAHKAKEFMLIPLEQGGTTKYEGDDCLLYEFTHSPLVLNGWIFSAWGLYDYYKYTKDAFVQQIFRRTLRSMEKLLPEFDKKYWSSYCHGGKKTASAFYHKLHIAQLRVMYDLFGTEVFQQYADRWEAYQNSFWKPKAAFLKKALEKVLE